MGIIDRMTGPNQAHKGHVETVLGMLNRISDQERNVPHLANNYSFNAAVSCWITLNVISFGIETSLALKSPDGGGVDDYIYVNMGFLVVFLIEVLVRLHCLGWDYFGDFWNLFDYTIVAFGVLEITVSLSGGDSRFVRVVGLIRIARLLRVVRYIHGSALFFRLWEVISGFLHSLRMLLWVSILLVLCLHVASIVLTTLIDGDPYCAEFFPESKQYFGSTWSSLKTLLQIVTYDQWMMLIMRPLSQVNTFAFIMVLFIVVVVSFGIASVMIAVLVEATLDSASHSKDSFMKSAEWDSILLARLLDYFIHAAGDPMGELSFDKFQALIRTDSTSTAIKLFGITTIEAAELFYLMDADNSGKISPKEFIIGLQKIKGLAQGTDLLSVISFAHLQSARANHNVMRVRSLCAQADIIKLRLENFGTGFTGELRRRAAETESSQNLIEQARKIAKIHKRLEDQARHTFPNV